MADPLCEVCEGVGFVKAAPISTVWRSGGNRHRITLWPKAVTTPCFKCGGRELSDVSDDSRPGG